jgi:hypothetical protein
MLASFALTAAGYSQESIAWFIQAGAYDSAQEAAAVQAALQKDCSPVNVQVRDGIKPYKVLVGEFSTYASVYSRRQKLKAGFPTDAFLTSGTATGTAVRNVLPIDHPFNGPPLEYTDPTEFWELGGFGNDPEPPADLADLPVTLLDHDQLLQTGLSAAKHPFGGVQPLEEFLKRYSDDPAADKARLRLARVYGRGSNPGRSDALIKKVLRDGSSKAHQVARFISAHGLVNRHQMAEAYEAFRSIANDGSFPGAVREQAMWRAAACAHSLQRYPEAYLCYEYLAENLGNAASVAEAKVQLAGLMFELVLRSKGSWDEVRKVCRSVADDENVPRPKRATAELMFLESYYEQHQYARAVALADKYIADYGDVKRETYIATVWKGLCLYNLNRVDEAKVPLEQVAAADIPSNEKFGNSEPSARAAIWLAHIADKQGNPVERQRWANHLKTQYPDGPETRALPAVLGVN